MYRRARYGGMYKTDAAQSWFEMCGFLIKQQLGEYVTFDVPVKVRLTLSYFGSFDLDNCMKAAFDLLTDYKIIEDDSLVFEIEAEKIHVTKRQDEALELKVWRRLL